MKDTIYNHEASLHHEAAKKVVAIRKKIEQTNIVEVT
jgi:hypothetical protein